MGEDGHSAGNLLLHSVHTAFPVTDRRVSLFSRIGPQVDRQNVVKDPPFLDFMFQMPELPYSALRGQTGVGGVGGV